MQKTTALTTTWRGAVSRDWVDYNGHMRDAFYLLLFSYGTDGLMDQIGLDEAGRAATGHSVFTMECHLNFLHEVKVDAGVEVRTQVLGIDQKRIHIFHSLHLQGAEPLLAASEQLLLNVDTAGPRSATFAVPVLAHLQVLVASQRGLPVPQYVGRVMALKA